MFIFFPTLIGYIKSCLQCKQIEFLRFANKCYLLRLKCFFKVRFAREIKLIIPKCANVIRTSGRNVVLKMLFS